MMKQNFVVLALAALCIAVSAQSKPHMAAEQATFNLGADGPLVQRPVVLSDAELAALASAEILKRESDQDPPITKLTREGLEAGVIHLNGPNEKDLIVVGSGAPFIGANIGPFWVIRDLPAGPEVVFSTIALGLTIQKTRFNGLRNIEAFAVSGWGTTIIDFRFNSTKYVQYRDRSKRRSK
jgi:hypothetical protein